MDGISFDAYKLQLGGIIMVYGWCGGLLSATVD